MTGWVLVVIPLVVVVVALTFALYPPRHARRWRHLTRPLRRKLRPRHYRL